MNTRNYIPSLGLLLAFFVSIDYYARRIFIGQYIPLIFLFIFGVNSALTYLRSVTWSNTDVLTAVSAQENPQSTFISISIRRKSSTKVT